MDYVGNTCKRLTIKTEAAKKPAEQKGVCDATPISPILNTDLFWFVTLSQLGTMRRSGIFNVNFEQISHTADVPIVNFN